MLYGGIINLLGSEPTHTWLCETKKTISSIVHTITKSHCHVQYAGTVRVTLVYILDMGVMGGG